MELLITNMPGHEEKGRYNIPGHCYVIEGEVVEERFAGDGGKLGGEVHQLSLWVVDWP